MVFVLWARRRGLSTFWDVTARSVRKRGGRKCLLFEHCSLWVWRRQQNIPYIEIGFKNQRHHFDFESLWWPLNHAHSTHAVRSLPPQKGSIGGNISRFPRHGSDRHYTMYELFFTRPHILKRDHEPLRDVARHTSDTTLNNPSTCRFFQFRNRTFGLQRRSLVPCGENRRCGGGRRFKWRQSVSQSALQFTGVGGGGRVPVSKLGRRTGDD